MGTASYILAGVASGSDSGSDSGTDTAYASACHGAGRSMSRHQATRQWNGRTVVDQLAGRGILIRRP